ncbi:MAG TPA: SpoIIE family protein phosphatase [Egibacteraceae bacterium]|nr:SpoIIE family protein phosphatase [Egibacteraceae bacterium]
MSSRPAPEEEVAVPVVPAENAEDLYEHAPCGYLSTLPDGTIIRVNETLLSWLGYERDELVGARRFVDLLSVGGRIYHETHYAPLLAMQGRAREVAFELVRADGSRLPVLVNAIRVHTPDGDVLRTSVLDASDRREYERELLRAREHAERSEARARVLAETLQASLIPPAPPVIPGLDVGAAYRPAGRGDEVGGDFYDVFETGNGGWAVAVGDVCGKGAVAAAVTALARYTIRAAAMGSHRPSVVLATLNAALLRNNAVERHCTVVYLCVQRDGEGRVHATIASGGHPLPILVREEGTGPVGEAGTLLGVLDDPVLPDTTLVLEPGEALFCYTDGLVEGRRGREFFGEERLERALHARRGRPATEVAKAVVDEVVDFQGGRPRDDMAAVLLGVARP